MAFGRFIFTGGLVLSTLAGWGAVIIIAHSPGPDDRPALQSIDSLVIEIDAKRDLIWSEIDLVNDLLRIAGRSHVVTSDVPLLEEEYRERVRTTRSHINGYNALVGQYNLRFRQLRVGRSPLRIWAWRILYFYPDKFRFLSYPDWPDTVLSAPHQGVAIGPPRFLGGPSLSSADRNGILLSWR